MKRFGVNVWHLGDVRVESNVKPDKSVTVFILDPVVRGRALEWHSTMATSEFGPFWAGAGPAPAGMQQVARIRVRLFTNARQRYMSHDARPPPPPPPRAHIVITPAPGAPPRAFHCSVTVTSGEWLHFRRNTPPGLTADGECPVCMTDAGEWNDWGGLRCGHVLCSDCKHRVSEMGASCPVCRSDLLPPPIERAYPLPDGWSSSGTH
jgi:hypothetical protein